MSIQAYILALIPLFVALDAVGVLPVFISLTEGSAPGERSKVLRQSMLTALIVSVCFLVGGKFIFSALGITSSDFKIGGGIILLVIAINDILFDDGRKTVRNRTLGVVPIGTPLIAGPAVLTTLVLLSDTYGFAPALASLVLNLLFTWFVFDRALVVGRMFGEGGTRGVAKVMSILLAAISVMMVRRGLYEMLGLKT